MKNAKLRSSVLPKAALPIGKPTNTAVEVAIQERRLKADENSGREEGVFTTSGRLELGSRPAED